MKKWVLLFFVLCLFTISIAQNNLVPNWSFEEIVSCPNYLKNFLPSGDTAIKYAVPWQNGNIGTVDLYSTCDTLKMPGYNRPRNGVPLNISGYQWPHTGNNYSGFYMYSKPTSGHNYPPVREYPQVKLISNLVQNMKYCVSFYVSPGDSESHYSTSRMGAYLSTGTIGNDTTHLLNVTPQIENPYHQYLNNKIDWAVVQGIYKAAGGENYITIGNFYNDVNTDTMILSSFPDDIIYYYADDISVVEYDTAYAGLDSRQCIGTQVTLGTNTQPAFGAVYNWSVFSGDINSIIDSSTITSVYVKPKITTTYVLQKQQCGITSSDTVTVYIKPTYTANAGADASICIGDSAIVGTAAVCNWCSYNWQPVQASYQNMPQATVYPLANTTYTLSLKDSCFTTYSTAMVNVAYCQSPVISVPNIFSPNADGINDTWQLIVTSGELSIINYNCTIYDRWGAKVFDSSPPLRATNGWNGYTTSGLPCSEGTYYYLINYIDAKTNEQKSLKGFLELVR